MWHLSLCSLPYFIYFSDFRTYVNLNVIFCLIFILIRLPLDPDVDQQNKKGAKFKPIKVLNMRLSYEGEPGNIYIVILLFWSLF